MHSCYNILCIMCILYPGNNWPQFWTTVSQHIGEVRLLSFNINILLNLCCTLSILTTFDLISSYRVNSIR